MNVSAGDPASDHPPDAADVGLAAPSHSTAGEQSDDPEPPDDVIELVLPARTEFAATVRVLAASLGADLGFSVDDIDDMRLALNEVFTSVADSDTPQRISLSFRATSGRLDVAASVAGDLELELDELALTILRAVVDEVIVADHTVRLVKRVRATVG